MVLKVAQMSLSPPVIYGQEVLYAARRQDVRSRPAQAGMTKGETAISRQYPFGVQGSTE